MLGKKVINNYYWHCSISALQPDNVQEHIYQAETLARLTPDKDYNVIKYTPNQSALSLLYYADFFDEPFPVLIRSYRIDLSTQRIEKRNYQNSLNPPILHRKELLLNPTDKRILEYKIVTETAKQLGLFDDTLRIGFKQAWENLIAEKGFQLINHQFIPIGNVEHEIITEQTSTHIARHLTALSRSNLSAPMQCLARYGFLNGEWTVFDYGCGKGDDIRHLLANNITVSGWDPHYAPDNLKQTADIVNLGFVINVIENYSERLNALQGAFALTKQVLVVSAMLINQNALKGQQFNDGVITQRNTFQKYFTQSELKEFIGEVLNTEAIAVAPGIFFIFKDSNAEQRFLLNRQRSQRNILRLSQRPNIPKLSRREKKYLTYQHLLDPLWQQTLNLGRLPDKTEIINLIELIKSFGSLSKALNFMLQHQDETLLEQARENRINDLLTYFALQTFSKRQPYKHLDNTLQKDIKAFFSDYKSAMTIAESLLFNISNTEQITQLCQQAAENGLGYLDTENALYCHSSIIEQLPALLRIYINCAALLYGDINQTDLIKIHSQSGKLSLMRYDDFENKPLPRLIERVKINLRQQQFELYQYGEQYTPPYLYLKSRYINEEYPHYAEQCQFDEQLQNLNIIDLTGYGLKPDDFNQRLEYARWQINGFNLMRSQTIPNIDKPCGQYLSYRQLIECGNTQKQTNIPNHPKQADSYTALYELAFNIIDPVIDYFGMIELTYGFCSHELGKHIKKNVAPKLDQHAAHELNSKNNPICPRLGAAVDFIIQDENMREVADWIAENTNFDRLYFYAENRPIHVSYSENPKGEYIDLILTESRRQVPKIKRHY